MSYRVEEIEGIGASYAERLKALGIDTTEKLLQHCATPRGRQTLADESGLSPKLLLKWANHADLFRIKGVAGQFAELLEAAGVDTVKEFRHRVAANLRPTLEKINDQKHLCGRVPSEKELAAMIEQAKELPPVLTY